MLLVLCLPASAWAGSFGWEEPGNFTASGLGSNPDHDSYGAKPWSYVKGAAGLLGVSHDPSSFTLLPRFSGDLRGGLAGWTDSSDGSLVATNPASAPVSDGAGDTFPAGALALTPFGRGLVALGWTSPISHAATVTVTGTIAGAGSASCFTWTLDQDGAALPGASGTGAGTIAASTTVPAGGALYLTVRRSGVPLLSNGTECATVAVTLHIAETETAGPHITLSGPGAGALVTGHQPLFSGTASTAFGAAGKVTVRLFSGTSATGSPLQTLSTTRSAGGAYSVAPSAPLADGRYTAQAEQDDLASPSDQGFSGANTFVVHNAAATIKLRSLGTKPLRTSAPTFTGIAGTAAGDTPSVTIAIYPGADTNSSPLSFSVGSVDSRGAFSVKVVPPLPDGRYTAIAAQVTSVGAGLSRPLSFRVKLHAPLLRLAAPRSGSEVANLHPTFFGVAGTVPGDSAKVTLTLHAGKSRSGRTVGKFSVAVKHGAFALRLRKPLAVGSYTAEVTQRDDAGHSSRVTTSFVVVLPPSIIGSTVSLSHADAVTVPITCLAPANTVCGGAVLVLTTRPLSTVYGAPTGQVRLLFAHVSIPAGSTVSVARQLAAYIAQALRRAHSVQVRVVVRLSGAGSAAALRTLDVRG